MVQRSPADDISSQNTEFTIKITGHNLTNIIEELRTDLVSDEVMSDAPNDNVSTLVSIDGCSTKLKISTLEPSKKKLKIREEILPQRVVLILPDESPTKFTSKNKALIPSQNQLSSRSPELNTEKKINAIKSSMKKINRKSYQTLVSSSVALSTSSLLEDTVDSEIDKCTVTTSLLNSPNLELSLDSIESKKKNLQSSTSVIELNGASYQPSVLTSLNFKSPNTVNESQISKKKNPEDSTSILLRHSITPPIRNKTPQVNLNESPVHCAISPRSSASLKTIKIRRNNLKPLDLKLLKNFLPRVKNSQVIESTSQSLSFTTEKDKLPFNANKSRFLSKENAIEATDNFPIREILNHNETKGTKTESESVSTIKKIQLLDRHFSPKMLELAQNNKKKIQKCDSCEKLRLEVDGQWSIITKLKNELMKYSSLNMQHSNTPQNLDNEETHEILMAQIDDMNRELTEKLRKEKICNTELIIALINREKRINELERKLECVSKIFNETKVTASVLKKKIDDIGMMRKEKLKTDDTLKHYLKKSEFEKVDKFSLKPRPSLTDNLKTLERVEL